MNDEQQQRYTNIACMIAAVVLLIVSLLSALAIGWHTYEVATGIICAMFCLLPAVFIRKKIMRLPFWLTAFIEAAIFMHAYGVLLRQYDLWIYYDTFTHSLSSFVITICVFYSLICVEHYDPKLKFTPAWTSILVFTVMMSFGGYWEAFEYVADNLIGTTMQNSPFDTVRDMTANTFGSMIGSTLMFFLMRHRSTDQEVEKVRLHPALQRFLGKKDQAEKA